MITVTLTGVDSKTSLTQLKELSELYPFVEWGLLYSPSRMGVENRYPDESVFKEVIEARYHNPMRVAIHYCGKGVQEFLEKDPELTRFMDRVQLNFNIQKTPIDLDKLNKKIASVKCSVITQHNKVNAEVYKAINAPNHHVLYDSSGGRGIESGIWHEPLPFKHTGYAGGLGPDNVVDHLREISTKAHNFWIDMESKLRNENDWFDLDRCESVLKQVAGYVRMER